MSSGTPDVVVSMALGGPSFAFAALKNVALFTSTAHLITHLSDGSDWGPQTSSSSVDAWITKSAPGRVTLNPQHLRVSPGTPGVLGAHLSNFRLCETRRLCDAPNAKFVLLAANVVLLRHGLERHVSAHSMSFCVHNSCTDLAGPDARSLDSLHWDTGHVGASGRRVVAESLPSSLARRMRLNTLSRNDSVVTKDTWVSDFVQLMHSGALAPDWLARPINLMPHEGTFYPMHLIRNFLSKGFQAGSVFAAALERQQGVSLRERKCPCCGLYQTKSFGPKRLGSCCLEELLLPTFAWQQFPHLLRTSVPPSVVRVWADLNPRRATALPSVPHNGGARGSQSYSKCQGGGTCRGHHHESAAQNITHLVCQLLAAPRGLRHFFGFKVPHFYFGKVHMVLQKAAARCKGPRRLT